MSGAEEPVSAAFSIKDSFTYTGSVTLDWSEGTVSGEIEDEISTNEGVNLSWSGPYSDRPSSEIETAFEIAVCYGPDHRCFKQEYIPDRYSVIEISNFELTLRSD